MAYAKDQDAVTADTLREAADTRRSFDVVPTVDFAGMAPDADPAALADTINALRDACENVGFFYLLNHGVPEALVDRTFATAREFFAESDEIKLRCDVANTQHALGYVPLMAEDGDLHEAFDHVSEAGTVQGQPIGADFRAESNQWPDDRPEFRSGLIAYSDAMRGLARRLFSAFALVLDLPEDFFAAHTRHPMSLLRILHYPNQSEVLPGGKMGAGAHTDHECFTVLSIDDVNALQVRSGEGEWLFVPRIPGAFVVNVGDQLARWTNDRFASTLHRVVNVTGRERYSIPFFAGPDDECVIAPLPTCTGPDNPPRYEPVIAGEYVMGNIYSSFGRASEG